MISVLIPVYNEEELLVPSAQKIHAYLAERGILHEVIAVSNGSTDATNTIGAAFATREAWFRFHAISERGVGRAFRLAAESATGDILVSLDIDLPTDLAFIEYATDLLKHSDIVIGSKVMGNQRRALLRILGSVIYILLAQLVFRLTVSDFAPSAKAFRRSAILPALSHLDSWTGYVFELCLYARLHGRRIVQVSVDCEDRRKSRFNLLHEGAYRYSHLFRSFLLLRDHSSWYHAIKPSN